MAFDVVANDTDVDSGDTRSLTGIGTVTVTSLNGDVNGINASAAFSMVGGKIQFNPGTLFDHLDHDDTATVVVNYTIYRQPCRHRLVHADAHGQRRQRWPRRGIRMPAAPPKMK